MTRKHLIGESRNSYNCILSIKENAKLYSQQLQVLLANNKDLEYDVLMRKSFYCYLKREQQKVMHGTDSFYGILSLWSEAKKYGYHNTIILSFIAQDKAFNILDPSMAFSAFCKMVCNALYFCESLCGFLSE